VILDPCRGFEYDKPVTARYVALIRGVNNIGKARRVAMADLRVLFEELGFRDVRTLLNSGNVIFSAPDSARDDILARIKKGFFSKLGLSSPVTVLTGQEVAAVVRNDPFSGVSTNPSRLLVVVPRMRSDQRRLRPLLKERWAPEALALGNRVGYLWCANGVAKSPLCAAVDRALERSGTARNIATFTKILALMEGRSS
jgi:uncharacterized protein (DUF1697 family)